MTGTVQPPAGMGSIHRPLPLHGTLQVANPALVGVYHVRVIALIRLNGETRRHSRSLTITVP